MEISITSVSAINGGAEIAVSVRIKSGENFETKRIVLFSRRYSELSLSRGIISEEDLESLEYEAEVCSAVKRGMYILGYGACSRKNMILKLRSKGFSRESAEDASDYLLSLGYIKEEEDAIREAERCLKKLWGKRRISAFLYEKGYSEEAINSALDSLENVDFSELCAELISKKFGRVSNDPESIRKLFASLTRYGYSSSEIKSAIKKR